MGNQGGQHECRSDRQQGNLEGGMLRNQGRTLMVKVRLVGKEVIVRVDQVEVGQVVVSRVVGQVVVVGGRNRVGRVGVDQVVQVVENDGYHDGHRWGLDRWG